MTRAEAIERYRHLRAISKQHLGAALDFIAKPTLMEYARKLGAVRANTIILDDMADFAYIYDLALYTAKEGRSRAIDRYARSVHPARDSDEALMLCAAQAAYFATCLVEGPHETAGLNIFDVARQKTVRLMDEGFEASMPVGALFASRLQPIDGFVMTTGTAVPLDSLTLKDILSNLPFGAKSAAAVVEDYRFQIAVFRAHLSGETGMRVEHRDFGEPLETEAA
jgi:hypothetical protein